MVWANYIPWMIMFSEFLHCWQTDMPTVYSTYVCLQDPVKWETVRETISTDSTHKLLPKFWLWPETIKRDRVQTMVWMQVSFLWWWAMYVALTHLEQLTPKFGGGRTLVKLQGTNMMWQYHCDKRQYRTGSINDRNTKFSDIIFILICTMGDCYYLSKWFRPNLDWSKPCLNRV